jgi:YkoY family integral membrane protein
LIHITPNDLAGIGTLVLLEGLLSADNALVLALLARRLPDKADQSRALTLGIMLSFGFRALGLLLASYVIQFWFLRAAGAGYLIYLAYSHFFAKGGHGKDDAHAEGPDGRAAGEAGDTINVKPLDPKERKRNFNKVVIALALTDLAFAIDSILVAVAVTKTMWVIYAGVALGIIALRLVADAFMRLLEKYPALDHTAYLLVAWAGLKLALEAVESFMHTTLHMKGPHLEMPSNVFWAGMAVITVGGVIFALRHPAKPETPHTPEETAAEAELHALDSDFAHKSADARAGKARAADTPTAP